MEEREDFQNLSLLERRRERHEKIFPFILLKVKQYWHFDKE